MFGPCNILLKLAKNSRVMAKNHIPKYEHAHQFWFINWSNMNIFEEIKFYLIFLIISSRAWTLCQKNHEKSNRKTQKSLKLEFRNNFSKVSCTFYPKILKECGRRCIFDYMNFAKTTRTPHLV